MPQQLTSLLLPNVRTDPIAPRAEASKNVSSPKDRNDREDNFARTLDREVGVNETRGRERTKAADDTRTQDTRSTASQPEKSTATETQKSDTTAVAGETENEQADFTTLSEIVAASTAPKTTTLNPAIEALQTKAGDTAANARALTQNIDLTSKNSAIIQAVTEIATSVASTTISAEKPNALTPNSNTILADFAALNSTANSGLTQTEIQKAQAIELAKTEATNSGTENLQNGEKANKKFANLLQASSSYSAQTQNATASSAFTNASANIAQTASLETTGVSSDISQTSGELSITPQNGHAVSTKLGTAIQSNQSSQTAVNSLALQISKRIDGGLNRFQIRMDPAELGRIDVKVEFSNDGRMTAHLTVERPETLDMLQKDARMLERALSETGLNTDKDTLNFSLKDQSDNAFENFQNEANNASDDTGSNLRDDEDGDAILPDIAAYQNLVSSTAVDIRI